MIEHTITARAAGKSLTLDEINRFLDEASNAGAQPGDVAQTPASLSSGGIRSIAVTVTMSEPVEAVQTPGQAHDDPATVEIPGDTDSRPSPRPRTRKPADATS